MKQTMNRLGSLLILLLFVIPCIADQIDPETEPLGEFCNKDTNITRNSKVSANIAKLLPQLVSKTESTGFTSTSIGNEPDKVYGLAQCRGDISNGDCATCVRNAAEQIRKRCPDQGDARIWYDFCFLRYNTRNFVGEIDTGYGILYGNVEYVSDPKRFNKELEELMEKIRAEAVETKNKGLGKGETKLSPFVTLYALVQCTRDLSAINCAQCLAIAVGNFAGFCNNRKGCRVLYSSCYVRYELYPFFFPVDSSSGNTTTLFNSTNSTKVVKTHKL